MFRDDTWVPRALRAVDGGLSRCGRTGLKTRGTLIQTEKIYDHHYSHSLFPEGKMDSRFRGNNNV